MTEILSILLSASWQVQLIVGLIGLAIAAPLLAGFTVLFEEAREWLSEDSKRDDAYRVQWPTREPRPRIKP